MLLIPFQLLGNIFHLNLNFDFDLLHLNLNFNFILFFYDFIIDFSSVILIKDFFFSKIVIHKLNDHRKNFIIINFLFNIIDINL